MRRQDRKTECLYLEMNVGHDAPSFEAPSSKSARRPGEELGAVVPVNLNRLDMRSPLGVRPRSRQFLREDPSYGPDYQESLHSLPGSTGSASTF